MLYAPQSGRSSMVERELPKLYTRVRFPSPAPDLSPCGEVLKDFSVRNLNSYLFFNRLPMGSSILIRPW